MANRRGEKGLERVGQMPFFQELAFKAEKQTQKVRKKEAASQTKGAKKFRAQVQEIQEAPDEAEAAFMARQLVLCTLPHSDPGDVPAWQRQTGTVALVIRPGWDHEARKSIGYPYGVIPRMVLYWIITQLVFVKDREDLTLEEKRTVKLGRSLYQFMKAVGFDPTRGGSRSDRKRIQDQMHRLFRSAISFQGTVKDDEAMKKAWLDMNVAPVGELWWDADTDTKQETLWESWIRVGAEFYDAATSVPIPVDMRALRALKRSPIGLDLYGLINYATFTAGSRKSSVSLTWRGMARQLGGDYGDVDDLKKKVKSALPKVLAALPGAVVTTEKGGLLVHPGKPAIASRSRKRAGGQPALPAT